MDGPSGMGLAALALAKRGFHVFPIRANTKDKHLGGWKEMATADPDFVLAHWRRHPDANIGIFCGPSGLLVLDVDVKKGADGPASLAALELEHGDLPATLRATTPSGGIHLFFTVDEPVASTVGTLGRKPGQTTSSGLDTRGEGGYVVAVPSQVRGVGVYKWDKSGPRKPVKAPQWLVELIGKTRERDPERDTPAAELDTDYNLKRAARFLAEDASPALEGEGGNHQTYVIACGARDLGVSEQECHRLMLEHYNPRCEPPWDDEELETVVAHAYEYAIQRAGAMSPDADFEDDLEDQPGDGRRSGVYEDWVWVAGPKWFVRRKDGARMDKTSIDSLFDYMIEGKHFSETVFKSKRAMRKFMSLQYRPAADEFLGEQYNLWSDTGCGLKEGEAPWLEEHISWMCGGEANRVLDYLAHMVQHRGRKMSYALLIQGGQGIGKSWLGRLMTCILGHTNAVAPPNEELHGQFTEWALGRELVIIEELMASGRQQMANKLKPLITEEFVRVEEKHRTPYTVENHMNFLIFTNHEDPIPLEKDDRRFLVVMSRVQPRDGAYYDALFNHLWTDGAAHAAWWLNKRDLSNFNPKGKAPATEAKEQMRRAGMHEVEALLLERHEAGEAPFDGPLASVQDVVDCLPDRLRRTPRLTNVVGRFLRQEVRATNLGQHRVNGGTSRRVLWAVGDDSGMLNKSAGERALIYDRTRLSLEPDPMLTAVGDE